LVWNQLKEIQTPPIVTTDFVYVRFIGDRSIQEKDFGRIQIDRIAEMQKWAHKIKNIQEDDQIKLAIVAAVVRNMLGLSEAKWEDKVEEEKQELGSTQEKQRTLSDFLS
jgi:uncharacterized protein YecE (DUF72 family)